MAAQKVVTFGAACPFFNEGWLPLLGAMGILPGNTCGHHEVGKEPGVFRAISSWVWGSRRR